MCTVGDEEHVAFGALDVGTTPEHRHHSGYVAVSDVVLLAARAEGDVAVGGSEEHVGGVHVGAVVALGQPERHDTTVGKFLRCTLLRSVVVTHPDRSESEDRDLPRVPVRQPVETEDLAQSCVAGTVPTTVLVTVGECRRSLERREQLLPADEFEKVGDPHGVEVVLKQLLLAAALEPFDGGSQQTAGLRIELSGVVSMGVEEQSIGARHVITFRR